MQLVYNGPFDQVDVPAAGVTATKGEPVEIPDLLAQSLLDQGWTRSAKKKTPAPAGDQEA